MAERSDFRGFRSALPMNMAGCTFQIVNFHCFFDAVGAKLEIQNVVDSLNRLKNSRFGGIELPNFF